MNEDERAIREMLDNWTQAAFRADLPLLMTMLAEDVVFLTPGNPPMRGREAFGEQFKAAAGKFSIESSVEIGELKVLGDWAYMWCRLTVTMTPSEDGESNRRSGHTLTILRKEPDGRWVIARDANMLAPESQ